MFGFDENAGAKEGEGRGKNGEKRCWEIATLRLCLMERRKMSQLHVKVEKHSIPFPR